MARLFPNFTILQIIPGPDWWVRMTDDQGTIYVSDPIVCFALLDVHEGGGGTGHCIEPMCTVDDDIVPCKSIANFVDVIFMTREQAASRGWKPRV